MKIDRKKIYLKYGGRCAYCGNDIGFSDMQVDHICPKWMAGSFHNNDINAEDNLNPSCRRCNHYKRANPLEAFREVMKTLHKRIEQNYICKVAIDFGIINLTPFDGKFYFEKHDIGHKEV